MRNWLDIADSSLGQDEVYLDAVSAEISELIAEHEPKWTRKWKRALDQAYDALLADSLDDETREGWHTQQKANLFLRLEMEEGRLHVYVREPFTKEVLPLRPEDWMRFSPIAYIPSVGSDHFISDGHYGVIGADGSRFYAPLSRAFVYRQEIKRFLNQRLIRSHNEAPQGSLVREAIHALWNGDPPPTRVIPAKTRNDQIRKWIKEKYKSLPPSDATIKRELSDILSERRRPKVDR